MLELAQAECAASCWSPAVHRECSAASPGKQKIQHAAATHLADGKRVGWLGINTVNSRETYI